jgi:hypothetical protein
MRPIFLVAGVLALLLACHGLTTPPTGPGTEYPCGLHGVVCSQSEKRAVCCPQNHICGSEGGFSRCTAGDCCYDGDDWPAGASRDDGGAAKRVPQTIRSQ